MLLARSGWWRRQPAWSALSQVSRGLRQHGPRQHWLRGLHEQRRMVAGSVLPMMDSSDSGPGLGGSQQRRGLVSSASVGGQLGAPFRASVCGCSASQLLRRQHLMQQLPQLPQQRQQRQNDRLAVAWPANARLLSSWRRRGDGRSVQEKLQRLAGGAGAAGLLLWGKTKWVLAGLKFTKFLPALSMMASTGAYAFFYGWPFAVGMMGQIFVHESGHWLVMKRYGIPTGPMTFIPFMGAVIEMRGRPRDVVEEAKVAFGGPVAGGAAALALSAAGVATGSNMLVALADFGFMINLFNLLPIASMDGGRIADAVSPNFLLAGLFTGVYLAVNGAISNPIFYLILASGAYTCFDRYYGAGMDPSYYSASTNAKSLIACFYILLVAALLLAMAWNAQHKKSLRTLRRENPQVGLGSTGSQLERFANKWQDDDEKVREMEAEHERRFY